MKLIRGGKTITKEGKPTKISQRRYKTETQCSKSPELKSVTEKMSAEAEFRRKKVFLMQSF